MQVLVSQRGISEHQLKDVHQILVPFFWGPWVGNRLVISVWPVLICLYFFFFFDMLLYPLFCMELCKYNFTLTLFGTRCFNTRLIHRTKLMGQKLTPVWENRSSEHGPGSQEGWVVLLLSQQLLMRLRVTWPFGMFPIFKIRVDMPYKIG